MESDFLKNFFKLLAAKKLLLLFITSFSFILLIAGALLFRQFFPQVETNKITDESLVEWQSALEEAELDIEISEVATHSAQPTPEIATSTSQLAQILDEVASSSGVISYQDNSPSTLKTRHIVKPGDSLWSIAEEHWGDGNRYSELVRLNNLATTVIQPDQELILMADISSSDKSQISSEANSQNVYVVQSGDTLWDISLEKMGNNYQWVRLYEANKSVIGNNPDMIYPGQVLTIPAGKITSEARSTD